MAKVHLVPWWWALVGLAALPLVHMVAPLSLGGWLAGVVYLVVSSLLVSLGMTRQKAGRLGAANAVTATRSALVGLVTALVVTSLTQPIPVPLLIGLAAPALALDALDGWVARRTRGESALGARFDMEVDAFLILVLSVYDARSLGWWVPALGLMRYAFVAAGWLLPWMRAQLPFRYWRKVVAAFCGIALTVAAAGFLPAMASALIVGAALALLVESFGRDVIRLVQTRATASRGRPAAPSAVAAAPSAAPAAPAPGARSREGAAPGSSSAGSPV
ncbi:MAG TPA: CDP-alcohol phosphatidyltransferase family protein [Pseudolysinimonas sp.]|jgi:phosphatidylglycerophosphate synthase